MRHTWTRVMIVLIAVGSFVTFSAQARDALPGTNPARSESLVESMELLLPELDQESPGEDIPPPLSLTAAFLELDADQIDGRPLWSLSMACRSCRSSQDPR